MAYDLTMGGMYAVIPAGVLYDDRLRPAAKLLYGEIVRLAQSSGYCYATNKQLMGVCNLTDKSVSELVSQLRDCGHIRVEMIRRFGDTGDITQRRIFIGQILAKSGPKIDGEEPAEGIPKNPDTYPEKSGEGIPKNPEEYKGIKNTSIYPPIIPQGDKPTKTRKSRSTPAWKPERFEKFWAYYRDHARGEDRAGAVRAWDRLRPDDDLIDTMARALAAQVETTEWKRGIGIPYACRWIRNERWRDVLPAAREPAEPEEPPLRRYVGKRIIDGQEVDVYE